MGACVRDEPQDVLGPSSGSPLQLLPLVWIRACEITARCRAQG